MESLAFAERFGLLVDAEWTYRRNRRLARLLREARLRLPACLEDIEFGAQRGLSRSVVRSLGTGRWIEDRQNVLIAGPTGVGKTFFACALANAACRLGFSARYCRVPRLVADLTVARGDGSYRRTLAKLARFDLLVLDDLGITPLSPGECTPDRACVNPRGAGGRRDRRPYQPAGHEGALRHRDYPRLEEPQGDPGSRGEDPLSPGRAGRGHRRSQLRGAGTLADRGWKLRHGAHGAMGRDIFPLGLLLAGAEAWEVDCVGAAVMCFDPEEVRHLKLAIEARGLGRRDVREIDVLGESVAGVRRPFARARAEGMVPAGIAVHDLGACSSCMNAFLLSCSLIEGELGCELDVYLGKAAGNVPFSDRPGVAFGNCCRVRGGRLRKLGGCPPYPFALKELLEETGSLRPHRADQGRED